MVTLLQIIVLTVLLLLAQEALRRANRWAVWGLFLVVPLLLTPYWLRVNDLGLFSWFKYYTVFFCVCWGTVLRTTSLGQRAWARTSIALLLAVNIFEAVALDLFHASLGQLNAGQLSSGQFSPAQFHLDQIHPAHALNAAAGLLLIATLPYGQNSTHIRSARGCSDLHYGVTRRWVIGYTLWNWTFVLLNYPALAGHHAAVLAAGLIIALIEPRIWSQTRASTLGFSLLFTATSYHDMLAWMDTTAWQTNHLALAAAAIAFAFMAGYALQSWLPQLTQAIPQSQQQLPTAYSSPPTFATDSFVLT